MQLNDNNFLVWEGSFNDAPFTVIANNDSASVVSNGGSVDISPLLNDSATNGIDPNSLIITLQDNLVTPATWNPTTQKITYYLPAGVMPGVRTIKYKFADANGNYSNEATISITITARPTGWRAYGPSYSCELDGGGAKTGNGVYAQLEKYYTDDMTAVSPQVLKSNTFGDPDYIAPTPDPNCNDNPYRQWQLAYSLEEPDVCNAALLGDTNTYFTHDYETNLTTGVYLYLDTSFVNPVSDATYSDGALKYTTNGGQIVLVENCST